MILNRSALVGLSCVLLVLAACASGSAIVTGTARTPTVADQVKIYLDVPPRYETIGIVNASSDAGWTEQGSTDYAIAELKKQAAKMGANGVLLRATGEKTTGVIVGDTYAIPVTAKSIQGEAIFVQPE